MVEHDLQRYRPDVKVLQRMAGIMAKQSDNTFPPRTNAASDECLKSRRTEDMDDGRIPMTDLPYPRFPLDTKERSPCLHYFDSTILVDSLRFHRTGRDCSWIASIELDS
jgi:hypothetical protein